MSNLDDPDYHDHAARGECEEHGKPIAEGHDHHPALPDWAATDWPAKRAALADRWTGKGLYPMTEFEMAGAVHRDKQRTDFDERLGDRPEDALAIADYDRRGLLNLVAALLDAGLRVGTESVEAPGATITLCARTDCRWQVTGAHYPHGADDFSQPVDGASLPWVTIETRPWSPTSEFDQAEFVREAVLELQRLRGRMSKVTVNDIRIVLAASQPKRVPV